MQTLTRKQKCAAIRTFNGALNGRSQQRAVFRMDSRDGPVVVNRLARLNPKHVLAVFIPYDFAASNAPFPGAQVQVIIPEAVAANGRGASE